MFKKTKHGVEIDSEKADEGMKPRFGKRSTPVAESESPKKSAHKFGKKKARKQKIAAMLGKARKGA